MAEYAVANNIEEEPAFKWWVKDTLRKHNRIVSKVKAKYWRTTHKFGIEVPKLVTEAYTIDQKTGTRLWTDAIAKEMKNVRVAFEKLEGVLERKHTGNYSKSELLQILQLYFNAKAEV